MLLSEHRQNFFTVKRNNRVKLKKHVQEVRPHLHSKVTKENPITFQTENSDLLTE